MHFKREARSRFSIRPPAKLKVLEQVLLARAAQRLDQHPAAFALRELPWTSHTRTIADVTGQIGLSAKHFIQVFSGEVGRALEWADPSAYIAQRTEYLNHVPLADG